VLSAQLMQAGQRGIKGDLTHPICYLPSTINDLQSTISTFPKCLLTPRAYVSYTTITANNLAGICASQVFVLRPLLFILPKKTKKTDD
jgi:hypothetical protein